MAIDPLVPTAAFIDGLRAEFPVLPVSFSTEGLGGAERRLRRGNADLALCLLLPDVPPDLVALPVFGIELLPVAAAEHPLASLDRIIARTELEAHTQLVLSDLASPDGPNDGLVGTRHWRFVELGRRLDFLLAGFGRCRMPSELVASHLASGRLKRLRIQHEPAPVTRPITIYAAHLRDRALGRAGRRLLSLLRDRAGA